MCSDFYWSVDEYGCLLHTSVLLAATDQGLIKIRTFVCVVFLYTPVPTFWQGVTICLVPSASSQDYGSNTCSKMWSLSCIASWNSKTCPSLSCSMQTCNNSRLPASQLWEERLISPHSPSNFRKTKSANLCMVMVEAGSLGT